MGRDDVSANDQRHWSELSAEWGWIPRWKGGASPSRPERAEDLTSRQKSYHQVSTHYINLTRGQVALVDEKDYEWLSSFKWYAWFSPRTKGFYARRSIYPSTGASMHRVILDANPGQIVDHINRNTLDNRRANLRFATISQSNQNTRVLTTRNKSGFRGVSLVRATKKWRVVISLNGRNIDLGRFACIKDAALAYDTAARKLYGDFAQLNFPE
jgi:AP2 domain/HNH endonuclease